MIPSSKMVIFVCKILIYVGHSLRIPGGWMALMYAMAGWQVFAALANWRYCGVSRPDRA